MARRQHDAGGEDTARGGRHEPQLHLFDTYEGHPKPDSKLDVDMWGNRAVDEWIDLHKTNENSEVFWPRLLVGGVLIVDDYGHYKAQRKAVDDFFAGNPQPPHRIDNSCRGLVKTR